MPDVATPAAPPHADLRGDCSRVTPDWTVAQDWEAYGAADHAIWRRLFDRQIRLVRDFAAPEYLDGLGKLDTADGVPRFEVASERPRRLTGWTLVAVPGLIPDAPFFAHGGLKPLARLYWYMVEFGLIRRDGDLRAYGAGMLSSAGETVHSVKDPRPLRVAFDRDRLMRTDYRIDDFQQTYFVLDDFAQLFRTTEGSFADLYRRLAALPTIAPGAGADGDRIVPPRTRRTG
jgi:phenylalanine-4-hydroxylase